MPGIDLGQGGSAAAPRGGEVGSDLLGSLQLHLCCLHPSIQLGPDTQGGSCQTVTRTCCNVLVGWLARMCDVVAPAACAYLQYQRPVECHSVCKAMHCMVDLAAKAALGIVEGAHQLADLRAVWGMLQGGEHPEHLCGGLGLDPDLRQNTEAQGVRGWCGH